MSKENVKKFYKALKSNKQLYKKLDEIDDKFEGEDLSQEEKRNVIRDYIIPIAEEFGLSFTLKELDEFENDQKNKELNDNDLGGVAGGRGDYTPMSIEEILSLNHNSGILEDSSSKEEMTVKNSKYNNILGWRLT